MSDDPGHKAMLYFLEVLMNSTGALTISQLAGRFGSSNFTPDMRTAAGGNESGLKQFLQKYPSLFTIRGNMVALCDGKEEDETNQETSSTSSAASSRRSLPDVSVEMEAVQFFQNQMARREERWVPVKSLAGHLSQTTPEVRNVVGPQLEFKKWLLRHMHIFEVQGEMVSLREGLAAAAAATPQMQRRITFDLPADDYSNTAQTPVLLAPKTPPSQRRSFPAAKSNPPIHRSHSFTDAKNQSMAGGGGSMALNSQGHLQLPTPVAAVKRHDSPVTMTANEYKAVMYLKDIIEKKGSMKLQVLLSQFNLTSESIRHTVGASKPELEEFLKRNSGIFCVAEDETVDLVKNAKLSVIITGSRPPPPSIGGRPPTSGKGKIFHVAKLWGIIDLGEHEHVFFDRSIMSKPMDDLQKYYQVGETLCFNAILAHKTSRAKWKATQVWKENEQEPIDDPTDLSSASGGHISMSHSISIEEEMNEFLPEPDRENVSSSSGAGGDPTVLFADADLSGAGVIPIWNFKQDEDKTKKATVSIVPESYQMSASALSDLRFVPEFSASFLYGSSKGLVSNAESSPMAGMVNGIRGAPGGGTAASVLKPKKFVSVACQTVSTNDIIATQLYQDS